MFLAAENLFALHNVSKGQKCYHLDADFFILSFALTGQDSISGPYCYQPLAPTGH